MGLLTKLFRKQDTPPVDEPRPVHLAFVLLSRPQLPTADSIVHCYRNFAPSGEAIAPSSEEGKDSRSDEILSLQFESGETAFVALMPAPVPDREADEGAQFSVSSLGTGWTLAEHRAHLIVTLMHSDPSMSLVDQLSRFTSLLAAVAKSSDSVGIYWGNAGATHDSKFFVSVAEEQGVVPRIMLWTGISIAREEDGRLSMLSLGMRQLNLPDLLLVVTERFRNSALEIFFDLLAYVAGRGEALPEGHTVGRTAKERWPVHYVKSPIDKKKKVWRVEIA